jgi:hypothetical protein
MAYPDVIDPLQSQSLLPDGYCHPQRPLIVFKSIPTDPGGATGKLNGIENDKNIATVCLIEKAGEGSKIRPAGGDDHDGVTFNGDINQNWAITTPDTGYWINKEFCRFYRCKKGEPTLP